METLFHDVKNYRQDNLFGLISDETPYDLIDKYKEKSPHRFRERNFSLGITMQAFLYQASQDDKSEQNTVIIIAEHQKKIRKQHQELVEQAEKNKLEKRTYIKRGRPRSEVPFIQKSKLQELSLNTASYDAARQRMPEELMHSAFTQKCEYFQHQSTDRTWHNHAVYVTDGTTFKTMDTPELRNYFQAEHDNNPPPVPIGRLQGIINLYKGGIVAASIDTYGSSEGRMLKQLYEHIPAGTVLLGDDLYSGYGHFAYCQSKQVHLIVQGKHARKDKIIQNLSKNDCLVQWEAHARPKWFTEEDELPPTILLRRITITNPSVPENTITLYTTLIDPDTYPMADIAALFIGRWAIELSFLNIKVIMKMEYLRGKSVSMVKKEIYAHLLLYNIIRKKMYEYRAPEGAFPPNGCEVQTYTSMVSGQTGYVDKLGRCYVRRGGKRTQGNNPEVSAKEKTGKT